LKKKVVETCEMCSIEIPNPLTIKVEGALLRVCYRCSSFGNVVKEPRPPKTATTATPTTKRITKKQSSTPPRRIRRPTQTQSGEQELIDGYGEEIRTARVKKKLTQEQLSSLTAISVPFIKSIEAEKMRPTDAAARKIERELGIELMVALETELQYKEKTEKKGTTLGDIAVIKRFDYD
jgi:putative transcription factor